MKLKKHMVYDICALFFFFAMVFGTSRIFAEYVDARKEIETHETLMRYKPEAGELRNQDESVTCYREETAADSGVIALQREYPDVVGWLTIPNTGVDYPFVQFRDNDYYLSHDINGESAAAGSLFMDSRCGADLSSQNTIIHGHNMKNNSMFGTLRLFAEKSFFIENAYGTIYLPGRTMTLEFFAFMVVSAETEKEAYRTSLSDSYYDYVRQNARFFRDIQISDSDSILTLSTCSYEFENARTILVAKMTPEAVKTIGGE